MHTLQRHFIAAACTFAGLALSLPALAGPPPWAPAYGHPAHQHRYVYYPEHELYYAPETQLWFWLDDGHWRFGARLPGGFPIATSIPGISIVLGTARPYERHSYIVHQYGRPARHDYRPRHYDKPRHYYDHRQRDHRPRDHRPHDPRHRNR